MKFLRDKIFAIISASACFGIFGSQLYSDYGYISYSGANIGDDIQSFAAKRFLPEGSIPIDREFVGQFTHDRIVNTIVNGWYMHTKDFCWYRCDVPGPEKSWPPSPCINPLFISIHFTPGFLPVALSEESIAYLKQHGPIGARDYGTLAALQEHGVPAYFSGCLTLTLENTCKERSGIIYAVDLDDECLNYLKTRTKSEIKIVHHCKQYFTLLNNNQRLRHAKRLLDLYSKAKCVVTTRLHASMPCLALKTPVLLITEKENSRFAGLRDLTHWCTKEDFLSGTYEFNFDDPSANPTAYLPLREKLIETVTNWVKKFEEENVNVH